MKRITKEMPGEYKIILESYTQLEKGKLMYKLARCRQNLLLLDADTNDLYKIRMNEAMKGFYTDYIQVLNIALNEANGRR